MSAKGADMEIEGLIKAITRVLDFFASHSIQLSRLEANYCINIISHEWEFNKMNSRQI